MSDAQFPALGFDPAEGDVGKVREIAEELSTTGRYAKEAHSVLASIQQKRDVWTGKAAEGFVDKLGELPEFLDGANRSLTGAGKALSTWSDCLEQHQKEATDLEGKARKAIGLAQQADTRAAEANAKANTSIAYPADDPAAAQAAQSQAQANTDAATQANRAAGDAWGAVEDLRRKAGALRDKWEGDARVCIEALNNAADGAPDSGLFDDIGDAVGAAVDWAKENLGDIAGLVSAIAGVLAFIPVLTPLMAPIAIGAGAVALGAHGTEMVVEGKWDDPHAWAELAGDAIGLIPGAKALGKGAEAFGESMAGVDKMVDVTKNAGSMGDAAHAGTNTFLREMSQPSKATQWVADRLVGGDVLLHADASALATNLAKGMEGSAVVGLQGPQAAALADDSQEAQDSKNVAGDASAILSAITAR